jgi:hypothetical protein
MRCYCYYENVNLYSEESQRKLIDVWKRSWEKQGWEPIVLNPGDAMQHPLWTEFDEKISKLPSEYGPLYDRSCFRRWASMAAQTSGKYGGGLMLDYDCIAYNFPIREPDPNKMILFCEAKPIPTDMGIVLGTAEQFQAMCKIFMNHILDKDDWNDSSTYHGYHVSDLSLLVRMLDKKNLPKPDWLVRENGVQGRFPRESYKTAPIVHFGYDTILAGYSPKWQHIEKLRPF